MMTAGENMELFWLPLPSVRPLRVLPNSELSSGLLVSEQERGCGVGLKRKLCNEQFLGLPSSICSERKEPKSKQDGLKCMQEEA